MYLRGAARAALSLAALLLVAALSACGGSAGQEAPSPAGPDAPGAPSLLKREPAPGEVVIEAEASPRNHGPFALSGRYAVAFAQYAPEAPGRDFAGEVPFVAELRSASDPRARPLRLFHAAARRGARTIDLRGSYAVEVLFGDFPYVIRFTPLPTNHQEETRTR